MCAALIAVEMEENESTKKIRKLFFDFATKTPNEEARFNLQKITWGTHVTWFDLYAATNTLVSVCVFAEMEMKFS